MGVKEFFDSESNYKCFSRWFYGILCLLIVTIAVVANTIEEEHTELSKDEEGSADITKLGPITTIIEITIVLFCCFCQCM